MALNSKTKCNVCFKNFTHEGNLVAHIKSVHLGAKRQRNHPRFVCEICAKQLSSNRSYREHKNTHYRARPFKCDLCSYAAASQMTLRRHTLRQHIDKTDWHYQCVYCKSSFVEPTSYQSHIQHKHPGLSGSFGCKCCEYKTLSSKNFVDHLQKHERGEILDFLGRPMLIEETDILPLNNYLVEDDLGWGFDEDLKNVERLPMDCSPLNAVSVSNSNTNIFKRKLDFPQMLHIEKLTDHGYMMPEHSRLLTDFKIIPLKIRTPASSIVPEPCAHVEIESESCSVMSNEMDVDDDSSLSSVEEAEEVPEPKDLGKHVLPDGQVDFDLD